MPISLVDMRRDGISTTLIDEICAPDHPLLNESMPALTQAGARPVLSLPLPKQQKTRRGH